MDAIVLCGGKGTRLASVVSAVPKPLAEVSGRPFLDYVLTLLACSGKVDRVILATGHLAHVVERNYSTAFNGMALEYSREQAPLGTGGAILLALDRFQVSDPFLVLNGDSFVDIDLPALVERFQAGAAPAMLSLFEVADRSRYGAVDFDGQAILGFNEKDGVSAPGLINAGVYVLAKAALSRWEHMKEAISFERDVLPVLVGAGEVEGFVSGNRFIDIGLPETYAAAADFFKSIQIDGTVGLTSGKDDV